MSMRSMMTVKVDINSSISTLISTFPPSLLVRSAFPLLSLPSALCCFSGTQPPYSHFTLSAVCVSLRLRVKNTLMLQLFYAQKIYRSRIRQIRGKSLNNCNLSICLNCNNLTVIDTMYIDLDFLQWFLCSMCFTRYYLVNYLFRLLVITIFVLWLLYRWEYLMLHYFYFLLCSVAWMFTRFIKDCGLWWWWSIYVSVEPLQNRSPGWYWNWSH